jgi:hypothetical protein
VKTCPQVLHRHLEVDLPEPAAADWPRAFSLGLNAIASSPPHPRHIRFCIVVGMLHAISIIHVVALPIWSELNIEGTLTRLEGMVTPKMPFDRERETRQLQIGHMPKECSWQKGDE